MAGVLDCGHPGRGGLPVDLAVEQASVEPGTGPANIVDNLTLILLPMIGTLAADRLDALGGRIDITLTAGEGATISDRLPEHLQWEGS